jgi:hypothetical protein
VTYPRNADSVAQTTKPFRTDGGTRIVPIGQGVPVAGQPDKRVVAVAIS